LPRCLAQAASCSLELPLMGGKLDGLKHVVRHRPVK